MIFCLILLILFDIVDVLQNQLILLIILFITYNIKQYCKQNQTILCTILNNISAKCKNTRFFLCPFL